MIKNDEFSFVVNTTEGKQAITDSASIRSSALQYKVCYTTTMSGGEASVMALQKEGETQVNSLRELYERML